MMPEIILPISLATVKLVNHALQTNNSESDALKIYGWLQKLNLKLCAKYINHCYEEHVGGYTVSLIFVRWTSVLLKCNLVDNGT